MLATKEKSHPGFQLPAVTPHPVFGFVISNTATEFHASVYDFCGGPLSSGYFRDAETGLDYADQRYHQPGMGRFMTPDPYRAMSNGASDLTTSSSWNKYAYAQGDPVNGMDSNGQEVCYDDDGYPCDDDPCEDGDWEDCPYSVGGGGGGGCSGPSTSGGSSNKTLKVKNLSTTSGQAITVQNDLRWLQQAIAQDPSCNNWLTGSYGAINYMLDVPGSGATMMGVGVGSFSDNTTNAVAGIGGTDLPPGMLITVNTNGAFFNSGPSSSVGYGVPSWITGGSNAAQAEILLHELAHDLDAALFNQSDAGNSAAETANNQLVMQNCGNVVNLAAGNSQ